MKNTKTHFFYVLYSDKTWVFDQSERAQGPIFILILDKRTLKLLSSCQYRNSVKYKCVFLIKITTLRVYYWLCRYCTYYLLEKRLDIYPLYQLRSNAELKHEASVSYCQCECVVVINVYNLKPVKRYFI